MLVPRPFAQALPAHVTAGGKILLANLRPEQLDALLAGEIPAVTKRSKVFASSVRVPGSRARGGVDSATTVGGPRRSDSMTQGSK